MPEAIKKILEGLVTLLEQWAAMTETRIDDQGVKVLKIILASELLSQWFVLQLVSDDPAVDEWAMPSSVKSAIVEAGCDEDDVCCFAASVFPTVQAVVKKAL